MGTQSADADYWTLVVKVSPLRIGLTGGIGSGKSTVAAILHTLGAAIVDADAISRATTAPGGAAIAQIAKAFGTEFIDQKGALNREKMRQAIFTDALKKSKLENILHPLIRHEMLMQANAAFSAHARCVVLDIPLLVESGAWRSSVDSVVVIDCTPETQASRVRQRSALPDDVIRTIISAQACRIDRLNAADIVVFNDHCSIAQLVTRVQAIASRIGL